MRLAIFSKADIIGAYNLNALLSNIKKLASEVTIYLSDKVFPNERGFQPVDTLTFCERDYPLTQLFPSLEKQENRNSNLLTFQELSAAYSARVVYMGDNITPACKEDIKNFAPDLIVSIRHDFILPTEILESARIGCINTHPGKLPYFRGLCTPFWAMLEKQEIAYCTVHQMTKKVDCGPILALSPWKLDYSRSLLWNTIQIYQQGINDLISILHDSSHTVCTISKSCNDESKARYFGAPSAEEFKAFSTSGNIVINEEDYQKIVEPFYNRFTPASPVLPHNGTAVYNHSL
ncbi:formyltransferase family protein [Halodesulfovibrio marinisediminis]|uniref:Formyl transferase n=1 Tax=Halodesulfovibrio marinisediminis DSM 17456 TaxID=1121457 RepID=A0A1N6I9T5_9BACT|nr:formyltransferase family protein [Halodesulfovibrio marinisediminis]SIO28770.1 Formyl transferase [Halodesulfovibrio marinisediminis DSM 17456]